MTSHPGSFIRKLLQWYSSHPSLLTGFCLISTDTIQMNLRRQMTHEGEGLQVSTTPKPSAPLVVHFPEHSRKRAFTSAYIILTS